MPARNEWEKEFRHITKIFPERLHEMMGNMTYSQLSLLSGVSLSTLVNWKNGRTVPDLCCLISVCNILDASIDWIVGLDEIAMIELEENADDVQDAASDTQSNVYYIHHPEEEED
tara:strand:- start:25700 stop:26044 length:345 start_codon:yes stop_codon:yes gene_type:complete